MRYRAFHVQFSLNGYRIFAGGYFPQFHLIVLLEYKKTLFDEASEITFGHFNFSLRYTLFS